MAVHKLSLLVGSAAWLALWASPAAAQDVPAQPGGGESDAQQAEQDVDDGVMIVTAQRRAENIQDVPITMSAISGELAALSGAVTTADLPALVPGVTISRVTANPQVFIRGVGTQNVAVGAEGSNPIYLDGFYNPSLGAALFALTNIERIEVLKGPQGTLFGRNATGGAVNVITRDPSQETSVRGSIGYGNYDTLTGSLYATTGLSDTIAADISLYAHHQGEGFGTNLFNGRDVNRQREYAGRIKLLHDDERLRVTLAGDFDVTRSSLGFSVRPIPGAFTPVVRETFPGNYYDVRNNLQPDKYQFSAGFQARVDYELDDFTLVSMTGYRTVDQDFDYDQDASSFALVNANFESNTRGITQEFQIQSPSDSRIQWIAGAFYLDNTANSNPLRITGAAVAAAGGTALRFGKIDTRSVAAFGQVTFPLGRQTEITLGGRYTYDHKELRFREIFPGINSTLTRNDEDDWDAFTWRVAASHEFTDDIMAYASVSRGYKSGEFAIYTRTAPSVNPEVLTAYEAGLKTEFADRRVRFNIAGFYYDYTDIQLNQLINAQQFLLNAASAEITGVDAELALYPVEGLTISAGATYLFEHQYTSFPNAPGTIPRPSTVGGNLNVLIDASGNDMIQSPDLTANISAAYEIPIGANTLVLSGNYMYNSGFFWEPDNRVEQEAFGILNAQIAWRFPNDRFTLRAWAKNLLDEEYALYVTTSVADVLSPAPPRTYGVTLDFTF